MIEKKINDYLKEAKYSQRTVVKIFQEIENTIENFEDEMENILGGLENAVDDGTFDEKIFKDIDREYTKASNALSNIVVLVGKG